MEDTTKDYLESLIVTYLDGSADGQQIDELKKYIASSEECKALFDEICEIWFSTETIVDAQAYNVDKAYSEFCKRTHPKKRIFQTKTLYVKRFAAAASVALVAFLSFWMGREDVKQSFADIVVESPIGSRTKIALPDGTEVWLNAGTRLSYSQGFGVEERCVYLSGEGYFEVTKNEELPFVVTSGDIKVSVLGTKFNMRDYPQDREVTVALYEGKVEVDNLMKKQKSQILGPNDYMVMDKTKGEMNMYIDSANRDNCEKWKQGYMTFDEMLFSDIINVLELNYNIHIIVQTPSLLTERYRGIFIRQEQTIRDVLGALSFASNGKINYSISGSVITIY